MKAFWNERYSESEYVYGKAPNAFLREQLQRISPSAALFPAEGEGRNAVYAARLGWQAFCFDYSEMGRKKALALAEEAGVPIDYQVADLHEYHFPRQTFGLVGLFFAHQPPADRKFLHEQCYESLRPGGMIILEAFAKGQAKYQSGGPKQEELLFSEEELRSDFPGLEIQYLEEMETTLSEGPYHSGAARVIRLAGKKANAEHQTT
ncbi:MAG: class I SAM-dependent methyltransferase [Phaeodactylibacter sp.]|nr:class I SAM-dependent methyltransferase [Phaeodactylibacter sp.]MCB9301712.1 class I SAM-dependent methyltransferase [Lewinellaceae bacterium]